jgi:peptidoglycan hydrolase CwlO-like protein
LQNILPHIVLEKITDLELRSAIIFLLNSFETVMKTNDDLKKEIQELKKEIAILKGEQGKPDILFLNEL